MTTALLPTFDAGFPFSVLHPGTHKERDAERAAQRSKKEAAKKRRVAATAQAYDAAEKAVRSVLRKHAKDQSPQIKLEVREAAAGAVLKHFGVD